MLKLFLIIATYLIGSISSAIIISRLKGLEDPRNVGSGNPGATNVLRSGDKSAAVMTLLGDLLKGFLPVTIMSFMSTSPIIIALAGLAAFLGHLYPIYYGFKGGKGVATAAGVLLAISPMSLLFLVGVWFATAAITRYSSLASLVAAVAAPILMMLIIPEPAYIILDGILAAFLVWRHRANIKRLRNGSESKIKLG